MWSMPITAWSLASKLLRTVVARLCIAMLTIVAAHALTTNVSVAQTEDEEISSEADFDEEAEPAPIVKKKLKRRAASNPVAAKARIKTGTKVRAKRQYAKAASKARTKLVSKKPRGKAKRGYAAKTKSSKLRYASRPKSTKARYAAAKKRVAPARVARNGTRRYQKLAGRPGGVRGNLAGCIPGQLRSVLGEIARVFGAVSVSSSYRSPSHNRAVGGAKRSWHMRCQAVDFRVAGNGHSVLNFIRSHPKVGGYKRYRAGFFHIDTGPRRTW